MAKLILSKFVMLGMEFSSIPASVTRTKSDSFTTARVLSSISLLPFVIEPWALAYVALMDLELDMGSALVPYNSFPLSYTFALNMFVQRTDINRNRIVISGLFSG